VSTLVFVLIFVALALGTVVVAMSAGRGGVGAAMHSQSRGSRRFATLAFLVFLAAFGVAIPALVIVGNHDSDDIPHAQVTGLTAQEKHGQELFGRRCGLCHTLKAANSVAQVGPNLDELAPNEKLVLTTIQQGVSRGGGQMPANIYSGQDAIDVAKFVAKSVGASEPSGG